VNSQNPQAVFDAGAHAGVMQDKATPPRIYKASGKLSNSSLPAQPRPKHHGSQKRKLRQVSGCVPQNIFAEIERMREKWAKDQGKTERLSRSEVVGTLVKRGVQGNIDMQYGSMLEPVIKNEIKKDIGGYNNHVSFLAVNAYYKAAEADFKLDELLGYILRDSTELQKIKTAARRQSRADLNQKTGEKE
jgi:hypothetical protein